MKISIKPLNFNSVSEAKKPYLKFFKFEASVSEMRPAGLGLRFLIDIDIFALQAVFCIWSFYIGFEHDLCDCTDCKIKRGEMKLASISLDEFKNKTLEEIINARRNEGDFSNESK
jgi:hypothetical protein